MALTCVTLLVPACADDQGTSVVHESSESLPHPAQMQPQQQRLNEARRDLQAPLAPAESYRAEEQDMMKLSVGDIPASAAVPAAPVVLGALTNPGRSIDVSQLGAELFGEPLLDEQTSVPASISDGEFNREAYDLIQENPFLSPADSPLSTFSIDVDTASYSNVRRYLNSGQLPPRDAVRIEELINYFEYDYLDPEDEHPFVMMSEVSAAPWNPQHQLVHIGLQGERIQSDDLPPSNLVFLLDVSGSMEDANKLPLLKSAFRLLVAELDAEDTVSIVVYASASGVVLEPTPGNQKDTILAAIDQLHAGGSTAGGEGIQRAYALAQEQFLPSGNNRVILATDGDFNVGVSSESELVQLIEAKRESGIFLTVLGFGTGNLQDSKIEQLANHGNGHYAYIDSLQEARKVLVNEIGATLFSIAKDVKIQVEFNPARVQAYRLIGYENRILADRDFNDDRKDAGELGAGHSVTALYEIIPAGVDSESRPQVDPLRYQQAVPDVSRDESLELMWVKLRYKEPDADQSQLLEHPIFDVPLQLQQTTDNYRFSAAVAAFGMVLRDSEHLGQTTPALIQDLAQGSLGQDPGGYRAEFLQLLQQYRQVQGEE
ncbi:MAG: VWA domain-containing protein [Synechococcaceae cyanobacterium SM2_3_1]|nr:VWA domain-containing protein [Synechococcaceae cyanobacterium SM2_3_1]